MPQNRTLNRTLILGNYFLDFRYEWVLGLNQPFFAKDINFKFLLLPGREVKTEKLSKDIKIPSTKMCIQDPPKLLW